jgi:hypothetical protein
MTVTSTNVVIFFEGIIAVTSTSRLDAPGETLKLGLPDRTKTTLLVSFSILGLCFEHVLARRVRRSSGVASSTLMMVGLGGMAAKS